MLVRARSTSPTLFTRERSRIVDQPLSPLSDKFSSRDHDIHKGAMEDGRSGEPMNAMALNDDGLPSDETAIAQDAIGARIDGSQG
jgi:hypothetical protein